MAIHIRRRELLVTLGGAVAWPVAARAQQREQMRRIGVLMNLGSDDAEGQARNAAFLQGLQELGWTVGRNVRIEYRWGAGDAELFRRYASELVALAPDVILAGGGAVVPSLLQATRTVPIVFTGTPDPVGAGFGERRGGAGGHPHGFYVFRIRPRGKRAGAAKREGAPRDARGGHSRSRHSRRAWAVGGHPVRGAVVGGGAAPPRRTRCRRDRARYHGLRAFPKWRADRDGERVGGRFSVAVHHAGRPLPAAIGFQVAAY